MQRANAAANNPIFINNQHNFGDTSQLNSSMGMGGNKSPIKFYDVDSEKKHL